MGRLSFERTILASGLFLPQFGPSILEAGDVGGFRAQQGLVLVAALAEERARMDFEDDTHLAATGELQPAAEETEAPAVLYVGETSLVANAYGVFLSWGLVVQILFYAALLLLGLTGRRIVPVLR